MWKIKARNFSNLKEHNSTELGHPSFLSAEIECKFSIFEPWQKITIARRNANICAGGTFAWHSVDPPFQFTREEAECIQFLEQVYREKEVLNVTS